MARTYEGACSTMLMKDLSVNGPGIGAQDLDETCPATQFFEGPCGFGLAAVALDVDVEHVFPAAAASNFPIAEKPNFTNYH